MTSRRVEGSICWPRSGESVEQGSGFPLVEKARLGRWPQVNSTFIDEHKSSFDLLRLEVPSSCPLLACSISSRHIWQEAGWEKEETLGLCLHFSAAAKTGVGVTSVPSSHLNTAPVASGGTTNSIPARPSTLIQAANLKFFLNRDEGDFKKSFRNFSSVICKWGIQVSPLVSCKYLLLNTFWFL